MMWGGRGGPRRVENVKVQDARATLLRLSRYLGPNLRYFLIAGVCVLLSSFIAMAPPWATKQIIDQVIPTGQTERLFQISALLVVLHISRAALTGVNRIAVGLAGQHLVYSFAKDLFAHLQTLSLKFFEKRETGEIMSRVTNDVGLLQSAFYTSTVQAVVGLIDMVVYAVILFSFNWKLSLLVLATLPALTAATIIASSLLRPRYKRVQEKMAQVSTVLQENIAGVRVSKAFARETDQIERFREQNRQTLAANMDTAAVQSVSNPLIHMISALGIALILWYGGAQVQSGGMTLGALVAFLSYLSAFYQPVQELIQINNTLQQALAACERIFEFLDERPEVVEKSDAIALPTRSSGFWVPGSRSALPRGAYASTEPSKPAPGTQNPEPGIRGCHVRFEHVTFGYDPGQPVLHDIRIDAPPGEAVALVGHTGSGKTSIVNLIPRFYDPDEGRVTVDGHDLRDVTVRSLREQIALVIQETFLFSTTIKENIRYSRRDATDEEIETAARLANAHDFIMGLPQGYDTPTGEGGVLLSRGQRQRIALARAILKDPRILILDEATSDVDTETEWAIQRALEQVMRGRTVFVIAHRLSTVRHADQILVLDHGRIVERGQHEELLARGGTYSELYRIQFATQEESARQELPRQDQAPRRGRGVRELASSAVGGEGR